MCLDADVLHSSSPDSLADSLEQPPAQNGGHTEAGKEKKEEDSSTAGPSRGREEGGDRSQHKVQVRVVLSRREIKLTVYLLKSLKAFWIQSNPHVLLSKAFQESITVLAGLKRLRLQSTAQDYESALTTGITTTPAKSLTDNMDVMCTLHQRSVRPEESSSSDEETTVTTRVYRRRVILKVCEAWCVELARSSVAEAAQVCEEAVLVICAGVGFVF